MPFGYRLGSGIFERCSDAIRYIIKQHGHNAPMIYMDDLIYIERGPRWQSGSTLASHL